MSKVLQERGFGNLPSSMETNPRDQVKSISTAKAGYSWIHRIGCDPYAVSGTQHRRIWFYYRCARHEILQEVCIMPKDYDEIRSRNGETKWPTCTSDIDGFCNGGELPGMVRVGSMTYFQDHRWYDELADGKLKDETLVLKAKIEGSFENFHEIDYNVLVKLQECWWKVNAHEIARFTRMENFRRGPYANMKTEWTGNPYLDVNRIFRRDYEASNVGNAHENQGHEEQKSNPNPEPSNCKIRRFEMMKYSFDDDMDYITIKESEYLSHSKDSLNAYRELLLLIDERWAVITPDE
ncbi:hypothetical protein Tco_1148738 [Tanacetum coccineum]